MSDDNLQPNETDQPKQTEREQVDQQTEQSQGSDRPLNRPGPVIARRRDAGRCSEAEAARRLSNEAHPLAPSSCARARAVCGSAARGDERPVAGNRAAEPELRKSFDALTSPGETHSRALGGSQITSAIGI